MHQSKVAVAFVEESVAIATSIAVSTPVAFVESAAIAIDLVPACAVWVCRETGEVIE